MGTCSLFFAVCITGAAQESRPSDKAARAPPLIYLRDKAKVSGKLGLATLTVETRYGTLLVPTEDILSLRFTRRLGTAERARIESAVSRLGDEDFDVREKASDELRSLGSDARRLLLEARKSGNDEVKGRVESLLAEIKEAPTEKAGEDEGLEPLLDSEDDEVATRRFTVRGRVSEEKLSVETRYGTLELELKDISGILFHPEREEARSLQVNASQSVPESWLNTKITVSRGQKIDIEARGQLNVPNYSLSSGPEGTTRYSGSTFQGLPMLSLVGKVGKNGKPFLVGKEFKGKAPRDGTLYLGIVPFRRNYAATGSYQAKVATRN